MIANKDYAYSIAKPIGREFKLNWKEYPAYVDKEETVAAVGQVMLYATAYVRKAKSKKAESSLLDFLNVKREKSSSFS